MKGVSGSGKDNESSKEKKENDCVLVNGESCCKECGLEWNGLEIGVRDWRHKHKSIYLHGLMKVSCRCRYHRHRHRPSEVLSF